MSKYVRKGGGLNWKRCHWQGESNADHRGSRPDQLYAYMLGSKATRGSQKEPVSSEKTLVICCDSNF